MLSYEHDDTIAHRLDPRSKLAVQIAFAATALSHTSVRALIALTGVTALFLAVAGVSILRTLSAYRFALVIVAIAPLVSAATLGPPWIDVADGLESARAGYRVVLVLLVSAAYVRSTRIRDSRAAVQRTIPGKPGQLLGVGIALVFRFFPVLQADVRRIRQASAARLGTERGAIDRASRIGLLGLTRAFERADRLSLALRARCFAWNPTLPRLSFTRLDAPAFAVAVVLAVGALL
ncbi:cobalt ABC transporter permease [Halobiforma lacisalsi AJ5]|uniref:Cobalt ABC transporter permease n=1 Tax=Natronobacterium lacisalsi AJ5 TaxID=358396 RepID=M0L632_NATLA|nr:energy-coupling factor transporter transmembrane component T [Halobiforma lacisalsi]APW98007.1 cobalt ABC transporter permease [Halobiforma lacisalsi AJ5]EMA28563.1 cobalt transporter [Halobiforma lacisalsi AJ5]